MTRVDGYAVEARWSSMSAQGPSRTCPTPNANASSALDALVKLRVESERARHGSPSVARCCCIDDEEPGAPLLLLNTCPPLCGGRSITQDGGHRAECAFSYTLVRLRLRRLIYRCRKAAHPMIEREFHQRVIAAQFELRADVRAMRLHGAIADVQRLADLAAGLVVGNQQQDAALGGRVERSRRAPGGRRARGGARRGASSSGMTSSPGSCSAPPPRRRGCRRRCR